MLERRAFREDLGRPIGFVLVCPRGIDPALRSGVMPSRRPSPGSLPFAKKSNDEIARAAAFLVPGLKVKGDTIAGRYRVEKVLGVGASGFVVAARHVYLRRHATLKILASTTSAHQKAQRRRLALAHAAASLRSPYIARITDTGFTEDGMPFIATERLEGTTLASELASRERLPAPEAVRLILQACEGLAEAHAAGIVHGDLKPSNLFVVASSRAIKILDFGMCAPVEPSGDLGGGWGDSDEDTSTAWFASPAYLAPEQIRDPLRVDARADVWALGVILHQLISGELPFSADTISGMLVAVAYDEPALLAAPDVPYDLARIVHRCLAKDPDARLRDVATLARVLAPFAGRDEVTRSAATTHVAEAENLSAASQPPLAMTMDSQNGVVEIAPAPRPHVEPSPSAFAPPSIAPLEDDGIPPSVARLRRAIDRRRKGAIATVAAAAIVACVSLFEEPPKSVPAKAARDLEPPLIPGTRGDAPADDSPGSDLADAISSSRVSTSEADVRAFVPPSDATALPEVDAVMSLPSAPLVPTPTTTTATATTTMPTSRGRASLAVRENPYARGFTHPTRLDRKR